MSRTRILVAAATLTTTILLLAAGTASAHTPGYSSSCNGARLTGTDYELVHTNTGFIYIDGVSQPNGELGGEDFGTSLDQTVPIPQDAAVHTVRFVIDVAGDVPNQPQYNLDVTVQVGPCGTAPTTTTLPVSTTTEATTSTTTSVPTTTTTTPVSTTTEATTSTTTLPVTSTSFVTSTSSSPTTTTLPASTTTVPETTSTTTPSTTTTLSNGSTTTTSLPPTTTTATTPVTTTPGTSSTTTTSGPPSSTSTTPEAPTTTSPPSVPSSTLLPPSSVSANTTPPTSTGFVTPMSTPTPCIAIAVSGASMTTGVGSQQPGTLSAPPCEPCDAPPGTESDAGCILPPLPETGPDPFTIYFVGLGLVCVIMGALTARWNRR